MTISAETVSNWLDSLSDGDLAERRRAAEKRRARAEQTLVRLNSDARKLDVRRKIVLGGAVIAAARRDADFRGRLRSILDAAVILPRDRAVLGLGPLDTAPDAGGEIDE